MFDINERIIELRMERHWSEYQLAEKSGIGQSTISSWTRTKSRPTVPNLEKICNAFGITLSQFFADKEERTVSLSPVQQEMLHNFDRLTPEQQENLIRFLSSF